MPWRNVPPNLSHGVGILLSSLWTSAAATLLLRERRPGLLSASWFFALAGTVAFVAHGAVTRVFGSMPGLTYIAVAIVQFGLLKAAFDRGFLQTGVDAARPAESH